jgi:hypothetical protein
MGSFARVKTFVVDLPAVLASASAPVLGCDLGGDDVHALPALYDAVVVIGSEGRGLSPAVRACVGRFVTIPRYGEAESPRPSSATTCAGKAAGDRGRIGRLPTGARHHQLRRLQPGCPATDAFAAAFWVTSFGLAPFARQTKGPRVNAVWTWG